MKSSNCAQQEKGQEQGVLHIYDRDTAPPSFLGMSSGSVCLHSPCHITEMQYLFTS